MSDPKRVERVRSELSAVLAEILLRGVKDPRVGNVSITDLRLSSSLDSAHVRFLSLGGQTPSARAARTTARAISPVTPRSPAMRG